MTEQEFDQQVWRRFDNVTTDTGIETTIMNVCFTTRSVRIYVKNAPPEWLPCKRIETHTTRKGGDADDMAIIEELHNRILKQDDYIEKLKARIQEIKEQNSKYHIEELLRCVRDLNGGLTERKKKIDLIERALAKIESITANIETE